MPPSSLTLNWDAVLSTSLFNWHKKLVDNIATGTAFMYFLMKRQKSGYVLIDDPGERAAIPILYQIGTADSYSGYDQLPVEPMDGITTAFYEWRQAAVPITISGREKLQNKGESKIIDLLEGKMMQAELGIHDFFDRRLLVGAGGSSITTPYTSAANGSQFIDPLPLLVKYDPTTSTVVGNINQSAYAWWRNQTFNDTSTTFAGFLKNLSNLYNSCGKGTGGFPNLQLTDQNSYEFYEAALRSQNRFTDYKRADIPFENILHRGSPVVWDEFVPDVLSGTEAQLNTSGTWWMLNTKYWQVKVARERNFTPSKPKEPVNQDATTNHLLWFGAAMTSNRRKQGVMGGIDSTVVS